MLVIGTLPIVPDEISSKPLLDFPMVTVASPDHSLAKLEKPIPTTELANHVQVVLTDRNTLTEGQSFGVFSPLTWKLADLSARSAAQSLATPSQVAAKMHTGRSN